MENRIIIEPAKKIREIARTSLKGNWQKVFVGIAIYYFLSVVVSSVLDLFFTSVNYIQLYTGEYVPIRMYYASPIYDFVLSGPLMLGIAMFLLAYFRKHTIDYTLTFEGFSMFVKGFLLYLLYSVKIFLWSLLFIIPGLIAAFRYSQAFYLRVDHPEWTTSQCLAESSRLMKGNKAKLFGLGLSFIGWYMLASIPSVIFGFAELSGIMSIAVAAVLSIPALFVDLYSMMSEVVFYELLTGNLVIEEARPFTEIE